jgi:hypothetical protein
MNSPNIWNGGDPVAKSYDITEYDKLYRPVQSIHPISPKNIPYKLPFPRYLRKES